MISFKTLTASATQTSFDERHIGGAGGQPDWNSYVIDTSSVNVTITLPKASICEGKTLQFLSRNPNSMTITINPASGDSFIISQSTATTLSSSSVFCQINLFCDGTSWWVIEGGSFT